MLREPLFVDDRLTTLEHIQKALDNHRHSIVNMPRRVGKTAALITIALHSLDDIAIVTRDSNSIYFIDRIMNNTFFMFKDSTGKYKNDNNKYIYLSTIERVEKGSIHGRRMPTILFDECMPSAFAMTYCDRTCCVGTHGSWIPRKGYIEVNPEDIRPIGELCLDQ